MRKLFVVASAGLLAAGCEPTRPPHSCSGAAVAVFVGQLADGGVDAGFTGVDGGQQPKPPCIGDCRAYVSALVEGLNANVPTVSCTGFGANRVECLPATEGSGCPGNTLASAQALEPAISSYLAAEWPELGPDGGQLQINSCPCRIY